MHKADSVERQAYRLDCIQMNTLLSLVLKAKILFFEADGQQ